MSTLHVTFRTPSLMLPGEFWMHLPEKELPPIPGLPPNPNYDRPAKTLILLKKDRNSSAAFTLGTENPALRITEVRITNDKKGLYRLAASDYGRYVLSCTDRMTENSLKNTTLKLNVTVTGSNGSTTATVSMKVSWM